MTTKQTIITEVQIKGAIGGPIWQPGFVCSKTFSVCNREYPFKSVTRLLTLRDMVLHITNDGDFRDCMIADAQVIFTRTQVTADETIVRRRAMDIRQFQSVEDCVTPLDGDLYWQIVDAGQEAYDTE